MTSLLGTSSEIGAIGASVVGGSAIAFMAGLVSCLRPCVLPLLPAYVGYLSGRTLSEG